jgi:hypothetical protein
MSLTLLIFKSINILIIKIVDYRIKLNIISKERV